MMRRYPFKSALSLLLLGVFSTLWAQPASQRNYLDSLALFWQQVYPQGGRTLYCDRAFKPFDRDVNVEHVYPMAWVTKALKCGNRDRCRRTSDRFNLIESDMHNLFPALKLVNEARSSYPFAILPGDRQAFPGCDMEIDYQKRKAEPPVKARGKIARAMLYMADRYDLELFKSQRTLLDDWNRQYPPDEEEKRHNTEVTRVQGKGNPYITR